MTHNNNTSGLYHYSRLTLAAAFTFTLLACGGQAPEQAADSFGQRQAPIAERVEYVVESPHGDRIDPYYWLRDDDRAAPEVIAYLEAENDYYRAYAERYEPLVQEIEDEMLSRINQDDSSTPLRRGDHWYYTRYEEGKQYPLYVREDDQGVVEVIIDVNELAIGHAFMSVTNLSYSPDFRYVAYFVDTTGRRQYELRIRDLQTGDDLPDRLTGLSRSVAWAQDNQTLFVVENDPVTLLSTRVLKHRLGQPADEVEVVYEETDNTFYLYVGNSTDQQFVQIYLSQTVSSEIWVLDAHQPDGEFTVIAPRERGLLYEAEHIDGRWIIGTDYQAPNFQLMQVAHDAIGDKSNWQPLVPHSDEVFINDYAVFADYLAINERSNGLLRIKLLPWDDFANPRFIEADEDAYMMRFEWNIDQFTDTLRYMYSSLTTPMVTYAYDMRSGEQSVLKATEVPNYDPSLYVTKRTWATARDGRQIPVTLLHRHDFVANGESPLYQYAYGSYGSSMDPFFSSSVLSLVDRGFVYAIAHIRGGQEMGRDWYEDGKLLNKKNTFTDFIDVTDHLVAEGYAHPDKVIAGGGSAGGLLIGAVANMAPEKYLGLHAAVPFVDVVTTMLDETIPLTTNEFDEWGNPKQKEFYDYMLSYSPYDNVAAIDYPAILVTTGLHDSQVQYFEPAKWVAKLRHYKTDDNVLLFRTNMTAGHGGSSGRFSALRERAEEYAFMLSLLAD